MFIMAVTYEIWFLNKKDFTQFTALVLKYIYLYLRGELKHFQLMMYVRLFYNLYYIYICRCGLYLEIFICPLTTAAKLTISARRHQQVTNKHEVYKFKGGALQRLRS